MDFNKRVQDVSQVFDRNWNVNKNNQQRNEFLGHRKDFFKKLYNIQDKNEMNKEILRANSVNGQVKSLNQRMEAMTQGQRINRVNNFKNNFK